MEDLGSQNIGSVFGDILRDIELLWNQSGIEDRDISTDIILAVEDSFRGCLVDYDCASCYFTSAAPGGGSLEKTGMRDTMAIALLRDQEGFVYQPIHDLESLVYTFLKVVSTFIDSLYKEQYSQDEREDWEQFFESLSWNDGSKKDRDLMSIRRDMWQREIGKDFTKLIKKLARRNKVNCNGLLDFLDQLPELYEEGVVHSWHGMENAEEEEDAEEEEEPSRRSKAAVSTPETKAKKTREIYLTVSLHLKNMFEELAAGDNTFLDLLCRKHTKLAGAY